MTTRLVATINAAKPNSRDQSMHSARQIAIVVLTSLMYMMSAHAQSQREQLNQMVEQLQKSPNDNALREKIIKLALDVRPPPAVPEEARRRMARGTAAFKGAKTKADYQDAALEFEMATKVAPWYGDAYYNLGVAQDKAEQYEAALRNLKLAQLATPDSMEIKDFTYQVEYRKEKENSPNAFSGDWYQSYYSVSIDAKGTSCTITKSTSTTVTPRRTVEWCKVIGNVLQLRVSGPTAWAECEFGFLANDGHLTGKLLSGWVSADTSSVVKEFLCVGLWRSPR